MKIPLFDIDGTLLAGGSGNPIHRQCLDTAIQHIFNLKSASINQIVSDGKIDRQIIAEVAALHGISATEINHKIDKVINYTVSCFLDKLHLVKCKPAKGSKQLLSILEKQTSLGLLTGNIEAIAWSKLKIAGLSHYFKFGAFGNMAEKRSDLVTLAQTKLNSMHKTARDINDLVVIGDSLLDVDCGKVKGIKVIAVPTGNFSKQALINRGADLVVDSLSERTKIITFLNRS